MTTKRDTFTLQPNAKVFLADLTAEIKKAKHSFEAQFYTFEADKTGLPIAQALMEAHERGVKVRLMVDHYINLSHNDNYIHAPRLNRALQRSIVNEWRATNTLLNAMRAQGIGIKMTNPLGFMQRKMLRRDHKKLVVIDEKVGYIGGINLSDHNAAWNDFMVKVSGSAVPLMRQELERTWRGVSLAHTTRFNDGVFVTDARGEPRIIPLACELIQNAKHKVIIESPYLWGAFLTNALTAAAKRGVDVSIIVPLKNNWPVFVPTTRSLGKLIGAGVHVYRFKQSGGMTHAKALLVDNTVLFGSNNFNEFLSGKISEANIATQNKTLVGQVETFLKKDIAKSVRQS